MSSAGQRSLLLKANRDLCSSSTNPHGSFWIARRESFGPVGRDESGTSVLSSSSVLTKNAKDSGIECNREAECSY
ncbi:hypothetical protein ACLKA6_012043 [Drosophila palustris]